MGNIATWLRDAEEKTGELITAIVIGEHEDDQWSDEIRNADQLNRVLSRKEGLAVLDVEYDSGYGGADCFPMYAYTESRVYFIAEYDGSTGLVHVPRHPINCEPQFDGSY